MTERERSTDMDFFECWFQNYGPAEITDLCGSVTLFVGHSGLCGAIRARDFIDQGVMGRFRYQNF